MLVVVVVVAAVVVAVNSKFGSATCAARAVPTRVASTKVLVNARSRAKVANVTGRTDTDPRRE